MLSSLCSMYRILTISFGPLLYSADGDVVLDEIPDSCQQLVAVAGRFGHELHNSAIKPAAVRCAQVGRRHHDDRNIAECQIASEQFEEFKPVHLRHHEIEQDQTRSAFPKSLESLSTVLGFNDAPALVGECRRQQSPALLIIFDHKNIPPLRTSIYMMSDRS